MYGRSIAAPQLARARSAPRSYLIFILALREGATYCVGSYLLNALFLGIPPYQGIEDFQDVAAIFAHAVEDFPEFGVALGVTVPLDHDGLGHFDVAAKLL